MKVITDRLFLIITQPFVRSWPDGTEHENIVLRGGHPEPDDAETEIMAVLEAEGYA